MTEGLGKLKTAQEERKARAAAAGSGGGGSFFKVPEDGEEQVRIIEPLPTILSDQAAYFHTMDPVPPKRKYTWFEICLDQDVEGNRIGADCPGCEANAENWETCRRKLMLYANVIWRDAPVRKKNDKGKWEDTDERKDRLAVWEISQTTVQDALEQAHLTFKDLTSRDFIVKRRGTGFDTTYSIQPAANAEGDAVKTPLTKADKELIKGKEDLTPKVAMKKEGDWGKLPESKAKQETPQSAGGKASESPFLKKNKDKAESSESDD